MKQFLILFFFSLSIYTQSFPPIQSYTPQEYSAANQNWKISETSKNEILFANSEALLLFNGTSWNKYSSPNGSIVRSVKNIDDKKDKNADIISEKQVPIENKSKKNTNSKFFSYLIVSIISFIALIILIDTLKVPLINVFPGLEILLFNLFEILKDIKLFIIDLY